MIRRRYKRLLWQGGMVLGVVLIGFFVYQTFTYESPLTGNSIKEVQLQDDPLSLVGYEEVLVKIATEKVMIQKKGDNCTMVGITTTADKLQAIEEGANKKINFRPSQHDIIADIFDGYAIEPLFIKITALNEDLFRAYLYLKQDDKIVNLDTKPSDALAIAARFDTKVYMEKSLFDKLAQKVC